VDSSPDLSPFWLDLDLVSDLGRFVIKSTFNFHCAHLQCFVLAVGYMTSGQPVSYTQPKVSVTYLIFTAALTRGLACSDSIYIVLIFLLLVHTAIKGVDLDLGLAVAGLVQVCKVPKLSTRVHSDYNRLHNKQFIRSATCCSQCSPTVTERDAYRPRL